MPRHLNPGPISRCIVIAATCLAWPCSQAATVSFTGGFTSFSGPVATARGDLAASVHTEVNGLIVHADRPIPGAQFGYDNYGLGLLDPMPLHDAGVPTPLVTFQRAFFDGANPNPNHLRFTPSAPLDLQPGDSFSIGSFTLVNGAWWSNDPGDNTIPPTDIGFVVTTHSSDPGLDGHSFSGTLRFVVTSPAEAGATAELDADYFYFVERPDLGTIRVYESTDLQGQPQSNLGTIDLRVRIGSLIPVGLENAAGAAFIGSPVPEPASVALWLVGLGGIGLLGRQRRRARAPFVAAAGAGLLALQAVAAPVPGETVVNAYVGINITSPTQSSSVDFLDEGPLHTPFIITRGMSNVVHGQPSHPVGGGPLVPALLEPSNRLVPANLPLNVMDPTAPVRWDGKSFAYAVGDGPSFSVGVGTDAWGEQVMAQYSYAFKHVNRTGQTEKLSPISLHLDTGRLFMIPRYAGGGDSPSGVTDFAALFSYYVQIYVQDAVPYSEEFGNIDNKASGSASAYISKRGTAGAGYGDLYPLSFPPGQFDTQSGFIAIQQIPEQTLTFDPFDLLPGQRLSINLSMSVSVWADGVGLPPIFYAVAGDPLSLGSGSADPNLLLQFAPVPEPATLLMLPLGLAALSLIRRQRAARGDVS